MLTLSTAESRPRRASTAGLAVGAAALVALLLAVLVGHPWALRYRRFLSRPLPDGTRYTFLYPAHLQNVQESGPRAASHVIENVSVYTMNRTPPTLWDELLRRLGVPVSSSAESLGACVVPAQGRPLRDRRTDVRWERLGAVRHNIEVVDARTRLQFSLAHDGPSDTRTSFEAHDRVIAHSFRVLPPGAAP